MHVRSAEKEEEKGHSILVTKDAASGLLTANVVPKRADFPEGIRRLGEEIDKLVYKQLTLKTDREPAISSLVSAVIRDRHQDIRIEKPPVASIRVRES